MTGEEIRNALERGYPVRYNGIIYKYVSAITLRRGDSCGKGSRLTGIIMQCELCDRCGGSVTVARPSDVSALGDAERDEFYRAIR